MTIIVDIGSHSLKIYRHAKQLALLDTVAWHRAEEPISAVALVDALPEVLNRVRTGFPDAHCTVVGTAVLRTHPALAQVVSEICGRYGTDFELITHEREADLIRHAAACSGLRRDLAVVSVGGRSIQIVPPAGLATHLRFGIVDLNVRFDLNREPALRRVDECTDYVRAMLPPDFGPFAYTGGELTYLRHVGVPLPAGRCGRTDFEQMASRLARMERRALVRLSPYDPAWMGGAIASNCVVTAMLRAAGMKGFVPSDLNVSEGLIRSLGAWRALARR